MFNKRFISIVVCVLIVVSNFTFAKTKVGATIYLEPPVINSISMDKKTATNGDYVNITFNTSGDILEGMIEVYYTAPAGNATKGAMLSAELGSGGKYSGATIVGPNDATGVWKVSYIILYDKAYNEIKIYNSKGNLNSVDGVLMDLSAADFEVSGTLPDITPPELKNISVQNRTVTIEASDDISGMTWITVVYKAPKGNAIKYVYCQKNAEGKYISQPIEIGPNDAIGKWQVDYISLYDNALNIINVYNTEVYPNVLSGKLQDLSAGDFQVSGTVPDTTPPQIASISVDKYIVPNNGGKITVNVDASDDISGIQSIQVHYKLLNGNAIKVCGFSKKSEGKYSGTLEIGPYDANGIWKVDYIALLDNASNSINVYNTEINSNLVSEKLQDLRLGDFEVKEVDYEPLPQKYITQNEYWTSNIINGDLYIGPQAVLTINGSVTVNGNIYVLGAIQNYGNLTVTGGIYANRFNFGNSTLYNGTVLMLGGTNSISSMVASNNPIDIPFKLYEANNNTLVAYDGKISITGATLPIVDLYMDNTKVNYLYDGTFNLDLDLDTNSKQQVNFKTVDVYGNEKIKSYAILNKYYDTNRDSKVNILDLANVAKGYNAKESDTRWQAQYDYNCDGIIDIYDLVKISKKIS